MPIRRAHPRELELRSGIGPSALWRALFVDSPAAQMLVDTDGSAIAVNAAWQELWQVPDAVVTDVVLGAYNVLADPTLERAGVRHLIAAAIAGRPTHARAVVVAPASDGRVGRRRHVEAWHQPLPAPAAPFPVLVTLLDLTLAEEARREAAVGERRLRTVVDHAPALIFLKDADHRFLLANREVARVFGQEAVEGRRDTDLFGAEEATHLHAWDRAIMEGGRAERFEEVLTTPEGPRHFLTTKFPLRDDRHRVIGVGGVSQDITERVRTQEENARLQVSERAAREAARMRGEAFATISHEIRTPLAGLMGLADIVLSGPLSEGQRGHMRQLRASATILLRVLNDVLDFSRLESKGLSVELRPVSVVDAISPVIDTLRGQASGRGIALETAFGAAVPRVVRADGTRLSQVLANLLNNAIKFSERGSVRLEVDVEPGSEAGDALTLVFRVSDQGMGIAADAVERLFLPFSQADASIQRRFGGTGLGLAICRALVEAMGGAIGVDSRPGVGSTFWFTLPTRRETDEAVVGGERPPAEGWPRLAGRVLVAEDNAVNQTVVLTLLERLGLAADLAEDGAEAARRAAGGDYGVVLMDCQMPEVDGFEATRRIRGLAEPARARVPIVALTAGALAGERDRCLGAGMDDYLTKPVALPALAACLARHLPRR